MRRHPNNLIRNLLIASLIILAAMHPAGISYLAQLGTGLVCSILEGILAGAAQHLAGAALAVGLIWIAFNAVAHRPHTRTHH